MSRGIVVGSVLLLACIVAAAYASSGPGLDTSLQGKYAVIVTSSNQKLVLKVLGIQKLGDRSFVVSFSEDANRPHHSYIPVDAINSLDVYDSLDAATGKVISNRCEMKGILTLRGKPLEASFRLHSTEGLVYLIESKQDGTYEVKDVDIGSYVVTVDSEMVNKKYNSASKPQLKVELKNGQNVIDFALD